MNGGGEGRRGERAGEDVEDAVDDLGFDGDEAVDEIIIIANQLFRNDFLR